jgi:hypothetical protein
MVRDDLPAGKRVRCPKCEVVFEPFAEEGAPRDDRRSGRSGGAAALDRDDDAARDQEDDDRPRRRPAKKGKSPAYWILLAFAGLAAAGAIAFLVFSLMRPGKMNLDTTFQLDGATPTVFTFDPISEEQPIKISLTPSNGKVSLTVYTKQGKLPPGEIDVTKLGRPLLRQTGIADTATLDGKIPAEHSTVVVVERTGGTPQVKLLVTN